MKALDLFAGHGWGVACQRLGIDEYGVEIMPQAVAVRAANGMRTIYRDVWDGLTDDRPRLLTDEERAERQRVLSKPADEWDEIDLLIASPPCQTFSMAGAGAGRKALDEVLAAIDDRLYLDPERLRAFGDEHDPRTALVLTPLAHVARDAPLYVVFEQVPPVLPVWERCAEEMRRWGYSVWTGNLQSEQFGVAQTRKRAILIARADGKEAKAPTPTHSRYYSRDPQRLDEGVLPWVSMAEALGWGMTERPFITAGNAVGRAEGVGGSGAKAAINREKERGAWRFAGAGAAAERTATAGQIPREDDQPAPTITGKNTHVWVGNDERIGRPAPTVTGGGAATGGAEVFGRHGREIIRKMNFDPDKPAAGDPRLSSRDHHETGAQNARATRVTVEEAAALQSYPADFTWDATFTDPKTGREKAVTKTNKFLQIGNACPPLLCEALLRVFL